MITHTGCSRRRAQFRWRHEHVVGQRGEVADSEEISTGARKELLARGSGRRREGAAASAARQQRHRRKEAAATCARKWLPAVRGSSGLRLHHDDSAHGAANRRWDRADGVKWGTADTELHVRTFPRSARWGEEKETHRSRRVVRSWSRGHEARPRCNVEWGRLRNRNCDISMVCCYGYVFQAKVDCQSVIYRQEAPNHAH
jgi:hypothetical protein